MQNVTACMSSCSFVHTCGSSRQIISVLVGYLVQMQMQTEQMICFWHPIPPLLQHTACCGLVFSVTGDSTYFCVLLVLFDNIQRSHHQQALHFFPSLDQSKYKQCSLFLAWPLAPILSLVDTAWQIYKYSYNSVIFNIHSQYFNMRYM